MTGLAKRVLAIGAHPDDIEMTCAGTLARFRHAGSAVHLAVACRGDKGGSAASAEELAARREQEARRSAELLGAPISFLGLADAEVRDEPRTRLLFLNLLRQTQPELILTHDPTDYHADHRQVSGLVVNVSWLAASPGQETDLPSLPQPPAVVFMENLAGIGFEPTHLVDVTATFALRQQMLACHASQIARPDSGMHQLRELSETLARLRGFQCGVRYAEGFRPCLAFGRRRPEPLFPGDAS
ncbi:MAG TPA: PIG-L deacetylase family protein [Gemmataceae bacterium]|jgi:LmbE family N-acetylglucosaminyl deacetylase